MYEGVRRLFQQLGWDGARYGAQDWNPLGELIRPGETVVLKPNLIKERHPRDPRGWRYVMTHPSVIRAVADYVCIALGGRGRVVLADSTQTDSSWARIVSVLQLAQLARFFSDRGMAFELVDLRKQEWEERDGVVVSRKVLPGDPRGYVAFDLGESSELYGHGGEGKYYGADYVTREVNAHHQGRTHEYLISATVVQSDVFVNLPKLKTHKKVGITCSLKNLVGINGDKNWLPHHTLGSPTSGGDEVPRLNSKRRIELAGLHALQRIMATSPKFGPKLFYYMKQAGRFAFGDTNEIVRSGNWFGNDTTWRMALDLNKILLFGQRDGQIRTGINSPKKRYLTIVDGIIAGEGNGPINPDPVEAGVLIGGVDPAIVDAACAAVMGFDPQRIPLVREAFACRGWPITDCHLDDIVVRSNQANWNQRLADIPPEALFHFRPHFGWVGHIERGAGSAVRPSVPLKSAAPHTIGE